MASPTEPGPVRRGPRVTLRRPEMADAAHIAAAMSDYGVVRNLSRAPWPYDLADAIGWIDTVTSRADEGPGHSFAIVTGDRLIGVVGINPAEKRTELGYWLARSAWGCGYATEAARLALDFAFADLDLSCVEAGHFADNAASGRVLQKLGFAYTHDIARFSKARNCDVACRMMILGRETFSGPTRTTRPNGGPSDGR